MTASTIISDIAEVIAELRKTVSGLSSAPDKVMGAAKKYDTGEETRFFFRPMDSVARAAKKSVLYFPVVMSDSVSNQTAIILARAIQIRAAEYVRLMVANMGPIETGDIGKEAVISALRGATLKDVAIQKAFAESTKHFEKLLPGLVDHTFPEDKLNPPLETFELSMLAESRKMTREERDEANRQRAEQMRAAAESKEAAEKLADFKKREEEEKAAWEMREKELKAAEIKVAQAAEKAKKAEEAAKAAWEAAWEKRQEEIKAARARADKAAENAEKARQVEDEKAIQMAEKEQLKAEKEVQDLEDKAEKEDKDRSERLKKEIGQIRDLMSQTSNYGPERKVVLDKISTLLKNPEYAKEARRELASIRGANEFLTTVDVQKPGTGLTDIMASIVHANRLASNQTLTGHLGAKAIVAELIGTYGKEVVDTIRVAYPGLKSIIDEIEKDADFKQRKAKLTQEEEEEKAFNPKASARKIDRKMLDVEVQRAINIAGVTKNGKPSLRSQAAAAEKIAEIMKTGDEQAIAELRKNASTSKIVNMLELLPDGVVQDGSIVASSNTAKYAETLEFNKVNEFQPLVLDLTIRYKKEGGEVLNITDSLKLGVKSVVHPVPSLDLVTGAGTALQRDSFVLQFFRMTSGETSFLKDFILNLNVAKTRASRKIGLGQKMLETLRRQSEWNERRGNGLFAAITKKNFVPPTTTLVVTADEVDKVRSIYGVDFSKPSTVRDLMRSHNLMGFFIVDEGVGLVRIFEDGDDDFDRIPLDNLKHQSKESSIKDIMTVLARS